MRLADIAQGPEDSMMEYGVGATELGGELFFFARDESFGPTSLWGTDGTVAGTRKVAGEFEPVEVAPLAMNGHLYFTTYEEAGVGLWKSDGTPAGTQKVSGDFPHFRFDPWNSTVFDGELYFGSSDAEAGFELWRTDGSSEGTERVADIHPGTDGSWPSGLMVVGDTLFFGADDGLHGDELWAITTRPLPGDANQDGVVSFGDFLILAENFGKADAVWGEGDFNGDGQVSFADFLILAVHFVEERPSLARVSRMIQLSWQTRSLPHSCKEGPILPNVERAKCVDSAS